MFPIETDNASTPVSLLTKNLYRAGLGDFLHHGSRPPNSVGQCSPTCSLYKHVGRANLTTFSYQFQIFVLLHVRTSTIIELKPASTGPPFVEGCPLSFKRKVIGTGRFETANPRPGIIRQLSGLVRPSWIKKPPRASIDASRVRQSPITATADSRFQDSQHRISATEHRIATESWVQEALNWFRYVIKLQTRVVSEISS